MPIVFAAGVSHAPSMFCLPEDWPKVHQGLVREVPQPPELRDESPEVVRQFVNRINHGFEQLRRQIEIAKLDALILVGDDQTEVFSKALTPQFAVYLGKELHGTASIAWIGQKPDENIVRFDSDPGLSMRILRHLLNEGFDPAFIEELRPSGRPGGGLGHAFTRIVKALALDTQSFPTLPLFVNGYHPPMPTGKRCYDIGASLRRLFTHRPERIGVIASGGLSHCPLGKRAGWVDEPLDRWVLDQLQEGNGEALVHLFQFDSDTLQSGTGEIRNWIVVAGAVGAARAEIVDYIPARHAVTGLGFAYWANI